MTLKEQVVEEVEQVPEAMLGDLLDYMQYLRFKVAVARSPCAVLSESSLAKDWLSPEEDEMWADL